MKYCEEFAALLDSYADGELSTQEADRVRAHLDGCPGCRAYVDDALAIRAAMADDLDLPVPDGFAEGVMAVIRADAAPRKSRRTVWMRAMLPLAACFAVVVLARMSLFPVEKSSAGAAPAESAATALYDSGVGTDSAARSSEESPSQEPAALQLAPECAPEVGQYAVNSDEPKVSGAILPYASLTLTASQAGTLLDAYVPVSQEDGVRCYQLTRSEYDALLESLDAANILVEAEDGGNEDSTYSLVTVMN